jgi:hypothetical protein
MGKGIESKITLVSDDGSVISPVGSPRGFSAQYIKLDTAYSTAPAEGELSWDDEAGTVRIGMPGGAVFLQVGQEMYLPTRPKNVAGVEIKNGELVYVFDAASNIPHVKLSDASDYLTARGTIAMATEDVGINQRGFFTTLGVVRDVKTDTYSEGTVLYLDTTPGQYTDVCPSPPNACVVVGIVTNSHATEGEIFVTIDFDLAQFISALTKEPTGFDAPENVVINYDSTTRKVTLTGTVAPHYHATPFADITTGYVSPAHADVDGTYFLTYDGTDIDWRTPSTVVFSDLLIAYAVYKTSYEFGIRECHGFMPWITHRELHGVIGTHKESGGAIGDYTLSSTTAADRRPSVAATTIDDEDLPTSLSQLAAAGTYTQFKLSSTDTANLSTTPVDIVPLSGNQPYFNEFSGGTWGQTLMSTGYRMSIWLMAIPVTADTESQKFRFVWIQGQEQNATLVGEQGVTPNSVSIGELSDLIPEFVIIGRIIIRYLGGNWTLEYVEAIDGTRFAQSGSAAGGLSSVTTDAPIEGEGTVSDPLRILGHVDGYVVKYSSTTAITVTSGSIEANGAVYALAADATHNMTSLAAGFDIHYIYIDDDASTAPTAVIIDSTTEPAWSDSLRGWYNGDDRCIGAVRSLAGAATIEYISVKVVSDKYLEVDVGRRDDLASNMNPDGTWQEPATSNFAPLSPVNAVSYKLYMNSTDTGGVPTGVYCSNSEMAAVNTSVILGQFEWFTYSDTTASSVTTPFLPLGVSRNIKIAGSDDDDNNLSAGFRGYGYSR